MGMVSTAFLIVHFSAHLTACGAALLSLANRISEFSSTVSTMMFDSSALKLRLCLLCERSTASLVFDCLILHYVASLCLRLCSVDELACVNTVHPALLEWVGWNLLDHLDWVSVALGIVLKWCSELDIPT